MAKKIRIVLTLQLPAGKATPAPPVGTALGPHGINIVEFTKSYNEKTQDKRGQIIPAQIESTGSSSNAVYDYEPEEGEILRTLLPRNLTVQIFRALLENAASEQGARMSAMDNATRNAGEMIKKQTQTYNRSRQAMITKELIEIISGAEAL